MSRDASLNISLTSRQLRMVRQRVKSGDYTSASEVVRESLRRLFEPNRPPEHPMPGRLKRQLSEGYKAMAARDRKLARDWAQLPEAWPE
ncbi:MAG: type II toxin-antitoxin system ParD family antitoxin [Tepidisphaeraceae bacterium]|jgi:putative addiction module CopG family antidote